MEIRQIFAENLKRARKAAKLSQEELAFQADLDRTYVSHLEREIYSPTIDVVARLAKALELDPAELLRSRKRNR